MPALVYIDTECRWELAYLFPNTPRVVAKLLKANI